MNICLQTSIKFNMLENQDQLLKASVKASCSLDNIPAGLHKLKVCLTLWQGDIDHRRSAYLRLGRSGDASPSLHVRARLGKVGRRPGPPDEGLTLPSTSFMGQMVILGRLVTGHLSVMVILFQFLILSVSDPHHTLDINHQKRGYACCYFLNVRMCLQEYQNDDHCMYISKHALQNHRFR